MVTLDEFSRVVSEIYASSLESDNWTVALSEIARILDGTISGLMLGEGRGRTVMASTLPQEAAAAYREYYHSIDFVLNACESGPFGLVRSGRELVSHREQSEFYADWQRRFGLTDGLFVRLSTGQTPTSFVVAAPQGDAEFATATRVQFVSELLGHLQQALRTGHHLAELCEQASEVAGVIDAVRRGIVIVGHRRGVMQMNSTAEQILKSGDGLCLRSSSIHATEVATDQQISSAITNAIVEARHGVRSGGSVVCSRPSGKRPFILHVTPMSAPNADPATAKALVTIVDPEHEPEPPKTLVKRLFGLTNAEAEVALRMTRGDGLKPIAADLQISRATVNTHVQRIFDKTDTHRQAELVRLLLAIVP